MRYPLKNLVGALALITCAATTADAVVNIQSLGASARSAALGNAFVAVADNGDAVFANPAGLATVDGRWPTRMCRCCFPASTVTTWGSTWPPSHSLWAAR